jgi:hypothetical protein
VIARREALREMLVLGLQLQPGKPRLAMTCLAPAVGVFKPVTEPGQKLIDLATEETDTYFSVTCGEDHDGD